MRTGFLDSPSNIIYFNLVIVDLLNSAAGILISAGLWNDTNHKSDAFWHHKDHVIASDISLFTFDANIVLVLGLCMIRVLWTEMPALHVFRVLRMVSWITVVLAYLYGILFCFLWHFQSDWEALKPKLLFRGRTVEAYDIIDCSIIFSIFLCAVIR